MARKILVIEDDPDMGRLLQLHLGDLACDVTLARDGDLGLARALTEPCDLVVLDLQLPRVDGLEICRQLRAQKRYVPILMLTARSSSELDRVLGLEMGADDYLCKPFSIRGAHRPRQGDLPAARKLVRRTPARDACIAARRLASTWTRGR